MHAPLTSFKGFDDLRAFGFAIPRQTQIRQQQGDGCEPAIFGFADAQIDRTAGGGSESVRYLWRRVGCEQVIGRCPVHLHPEVGNAYALICPQNRRASALGAAAGASGRGRDPLRARASLLRR